MPDGDPSDPERTAELQLLRKNELTATDAQRHVPQAQATRRELEMARHSGEIGDVEDIDEVTGGSRDFWSELSSWMSDSDPQTAAWFRRLQRPSQASVITKSGKERPEDLADSLTDRDRDLIKRGLEILEQAEADTSAA